MARVEVSRSWDGRNKAHSRNPPRTERDPLMESYELQERELGRRLGIEAREIPYSENPTREEQVRDLLVFSRARGDAIRRGGVERAPTGEEPTRYAVMNGDTRLVEYGPGNWFYRDTGVKLGEGDFVGARRMSIEGRDTTVEESNARMDARLAQHGEMHARVDRVIAGESPTATEADIGWLRANGYGDERYYENLRRWQKNGLPKRLRGRR